MNFLNANFLTMTIKKIIVQDNQVEQRLDMLLSTSLKISRAQAQKMIKARLIKVNNQVQTAHYLLKLNDKITITPAPQLTKKEFIKALPKLNIIAETKEYLIINKPSGLIVHGGAGIAEPTLTDALEKKYPELTKVGDNPTRPGIVHRLDKDASGLMVIAKNNQNFEHLKKQFQERAITKLYIALVYGAIDKDNDEIIFPISRSAKGYKMAAHAFNREGRQAITEFSVKQHFINYTLLDVKIKTGRTHQIRTHMSAYGHPIVGDDLYGTRKTKEQNKKLELNRLFLHAWQLGFTDLQGQAQIFTIDLPDELQTFLTQIHGK